MTFEAPREIPADSIRPGDRVVGPAHAAPFPVGPLEVRMVTAFTRKGQWLGPKLHWVEEVTPLECASGRLMLVERRVRPSIDGSDA